MRAEPTAAYCKDTIRPVLFRVYCTTAGVLRIRVHPNGTEEITKAAKVLLYAHRPGESPKGNSSPVKISRIRKLSKSVRLPTV